MNIEIASPFSFIPTPAGWQSRSVFVDQLKKISFYHLDPYSQIISKLLRNEERDYTDSQHFFHYFDCKKEVLLKIFDEIREAFIKIPSVNVQVLENRILKFVQDAN